MAERPPPLREFPIKVRLSLDLAVPDPVGRSDGIPDLDVADWTTTAGHVVGA
jgi:hypothetical protein